ncbi:hypothetical protein BDY19DRAFT_1055817 [Irpex rosettiformis]|uniref:Uncharacterized protein n=1 Tax=Irpex rosettiformis TaxID=378272 RepID=A0ACB8U7X5_9APHY|nr:hypothetical protein BDY19DRAFT_1055817 [Irpex rosettiformis]
MRDPPSIFAAREYKPSHAERTWVYSHVSGEWSCEKKVVVMLGVESVFKEWRLENADEDWDSNEGDDSGESSIENSESSIEGSSEDSSLLMDIDDQPNQPIGCPIQGSFHLPWVAYLPEKEMTTTTTKMVFK